jgi:hypothetical protein
MKTIVHVNQHHIKHNIKNKKERRPVFTVKTGKKNVYATEVKILGPSRLVYQPDTPLSCGARAWIETESEVECINSTTYKEIHGKT